MIVITGRFELLPEKRDEFVALAKELVPRERTTPGCLNFDIFEDITTPNRFLMLEEWESSEALEAHTATEEFARNEAAMSGIFIGEPIWSQYEL